MRPSASSASLPILLRPTARLWIYARFGGGKGAEKVMFSHLFAPAAVAFGTCSSVATIPTNMEACEDTGISKDVSEIVIPMGATMHMDGSAMSAIIKVAFLFGIFGQDFSTGRAILAIIVAVFSSVAMSGIPGGGGTGEMVLCSIFFPEQIGIALPIAWALGDLVDPPATMVNARSSCHDGERGDGLCLDLHRVEVCGRQGLAAEAA